MYPTNPQARVGEAIWKPQSSVELGSQLALVDVLHRVSTYCMLQAACRVLQDVVRALRSEKEALTTAGASVCDSGEARVGKPVG